MSYEHLLLLRLNATLQNEGTFVSDVMQAQ